MGLTENTATRLLALNGLDVMAREFAYGLANRVPE